MSEQVKLIAHGGFSARYPESSLESLTAAAEYQPYAIEMDVFQHPDTGKLICFRPTGLTSKAGTFTQETVREQIAAGASVTPLKDILVQISGSSYFLLDFKQPSSQAFKALLDDPSIDLDRVIIGVRSLEDFTFIRGLNPDVKMLALFANPDDYGLFKESGGRYFRLFEKDVTPERVAAIKAAGLEVWITPEGNATEGKPRAAGEVDADKLSWLKSLMVNGILVNDIEFAKVYLAQNLD